MKQISWIQQTEINDYIFRRLGGKSATTLWWWTKRYWCEPSREWWLRLSSHSNIMHRIFAAKEQLIMMLKYQREVELEYTFWRFIALYKPVTDFQRNCHHGNGRIYRNSFTASDSSDKKSSKLSSVIRNKRWPKAMLAASCQSDDQKHAGSQLKI